MDHFHENCCYDANKRQLNLAHRNLRSLDENIIATFGQCSEYLDLSHNRINNINWIYEFPHLKCLILDNNRLREAHFENLKQPLHNIHTLMLNKNELSDLKTTASILQRIFPKMEYLSLHGNPMCPDDLLLQPFCEFVPYEYNHYRTVLVKTLPQLKFLDHYSLDLSHLEFQTVEKAINRQQKEIPTSTFKDLWSKVKRFLTISSNQITTEVLPRMANKNSALLCASYGGLHSEGNRYITNSDL